MLAQANLLVENERKMSVYPHQAFLFVYSACSAWLRTPIRLLWLTCVACAVILVQQWQNELESAAAALGHCTHAALADHHVLPSGCAFCT